MQLQLEHKETNESRFQSIDKRWGVVEEAFRIQAHERTQDLSVLKDQLKHRKNQVGQLQERKGEVITQALRKLGQNANQSKENLEGLFQTEATFRLGQIEKKNEFIKDFLNNGTAFNTTLHQYATNKIKDVCNKLQAIDHANRRKTEETIKEIKNDILGQAQTNFEKQREKYTQLLGKISNDTNKELDQLRELLANRRKQREQSETKLRLMIASLVEDLSKVSETETKEGEMTYDCLLKLLEECCAKIQQAQLK